MIDIVLNALKVLKDLGFSSGNIVVIVLLVAGYVKLASNHFKHLGTSISCLEKKIKGVKNTITKLDKHIGILEARFNDKFPVKK